MKIVKYLFLIITLTLFVSCTKHELMYPTDPVGTKAEFQLHYFAPVVNTAANYIDSVYVNGVLFSSVSGAGQLLPYNGVPGGATGRFFTVEAGTVQFTLYRDSTIVYDQSVTLTTGKQNIFIYSFSHAPIVIDNGYPYTEIKTAHGNSSTWDTDSIETVGFYNFLYENATTPYPGKIQYQYEDARTGEWKNVGKAAAFGESSGREKIVIVKTVFNSSGYCVINYRMLDENGQVLTLMNSSGGMVNYSDWWTGYIGRAYMHIFGGIRTATPVASIRQWTSL